MTEKIIGIDLGTTNSEVAIINNGQATMISSDGSVILPSYVGLDSEGKLLVGEAARNQYTVYPERTVKSIKRSMGGSDKIFMAGQEYAPQEISAIILKTLKKIAENHLGEKISKAVITVPAYFSDGQRQATREAGEIAGLEVVKMINEPTAAALAYEYNHQGGKRIMVYDLGGGTFDVSVVQIEEGVIEVMASHGNNHLGGDDFDQKIVDHIRRALKEEHGNIDIPPEAAARIERASEVAKLILSDNPFASIKEEFLLEKKGVPFHFSLELSRDEYEEMIDPFIDETMEAIHIALKSAGLTVSDIDEILLVGGSTRTPLVGRRLEEEFAVQPRSEIDPDLCVADGAAIQAGMIAGEEVSAVLVDITPYTFGTSALGELDDGMPYPFMFVPIIKKNTPIPVRKSEVFFTPFDNQEVVEVCAYQGENNDAKQNIELGKFTIKGLSKVPAGNEIITTFELDKDGILHVSAMEKKTGLAKDISIDNAISRFDKENMETARGKIVDLFGEEDEAPQADSVNKSGNVENVKAMALVEKAERLMAQASVEDKEDLVDLIEQINDAMKAGDKNSLAEATDELSEIVFYLDS
ncbi:MAG: Hsp70 family protein [Desulfobulbaceae bacterium]|nr:Hsp70 family protein [Desulfobulbaceae bacterium]